MKAIGVCAFLTAMDMPFEDVIQRVLENSEITWSPCYHVMMRLNSKNNIK
ncbi:hypothetical protein T4A_3135 [Trichinella pseudospiralis]|uniref:Uncharacterized protein n=1 Tax=Trichinella pseudospiralis TaxID=6337 RepID=A0A0V1DNS7_TRIPS|nr:hypothetical protein T4A_3135 [Trichinella pseudospiralis]